MNPPVEEIVNLKGAVGMQEIPAVTL